MEKGWNGLPYLPISQHYLQIFQEKVYKIPLAIADDCPNRLGLKGMKTCIFCDEWGSAARSEALSLQLKDQIEKYHQHYAQKYHAKIFLAYFQAYTSTFLKIQSLKENIKIALSYPFMKGVSIGTRPDCLSQAVLNYWNELAQDYYVSIEFGVQSFQDHQLNFLRRGHTNSDTLDAILKTAQFGKGKFHIGIHLMFGLPNETDEDVVRAAEMCNQLPIQGVKLHHLHVLKNTPLEQMYESGEFSPVDFQTYAHRVQLFLEYLSPLIHIERLAAYSSRWDELIAPDWTKNKMMTHQHIIDLLRKNQSYQSRFYSPANPAEAEAQKILEKRSQKT